MTIEAELERGLAFMTERGVVAHIRKWVMGTTLLVLAGQMAGPSPEIPAYRYLWYLVPAEGGGWTIDKCDGDPRGPYATIELACECVLREKDVLLG